MPGELPAGGPGPPTAVARAPGELPGGRAGQWTPGAPSDSDEEYREEYKAIFSSKLRNRKVKHRKSLFSFLPCPLFCFSLTLFPGLAESVKYFLHLLQI